MHGAVRRLVTLAAVVVLVSACVFAPFAGRFLVYEDPLRHADAIFVLAGARAERWLEAVDLFQEGIAPRILLSPGRLERAEVVLRSRHITFPQDAELARTAILQLHVPPDAVSVMEGSVDNTAQEAAALHRLAHARGWRTLIVVTSKYHSHRAAFAFQREFDRSGIAIVMRTTRYDTSDPAHWWRHRGDIRFVLAELGKLVLYRLGLSG
ncbi:MAG TPA: YdcF family protein [Vicinamibacterales bacterium]|nr:YdcF family protein [Vicinamibacterales bacterium]